MINAEGQEAEILNKWYKTCLDWYDIWGEIHPYVEEQKDTINKVGRNSKHCALVNAKI